MGSSGASGRSRGQYEERGFRARYLTRRRGALPRPTPEERIVIAIGWPRRIGPPRIVKLLLGLHSRLQTRGDKAARLWRQGVLRAQQLERVVDLSGDSSAVSQTTERAEMLRS